MLPGPVFQVELLTLARRKRYYVLRFLYGLLLLYLVGMNLIVSNSMYDPTGSGKVSIRQMSALGNGIFATFSYIQAVVVLFLTPALVAGVVADERQRKTLQDLLASCLSSGEIVLGKLAARLISVGVLLGVGLPIVSLLNFFGGVDPNLVLLFFASCASTAFLIAAGSVVISVHARRPRDAVIMTYLLEMVWLIGPSLIQSLSPGLGWLGSLLFEWFRPVNEWVGASNPIFGLGFLSNPATAYESIFWMIGLQSLYGAALAAFAVARLRPVYRAEGKKPGRFPAVVSRLSSRILPRPACGDDPIWWKERHVSRTGMWAKVVRIVLFLGLVGWIGWVAIGLSMNAFGELMTRGFFDAAENGAGQRLLNVYLRFAVTFVSACWMLITACVASTCLTSEREEDTWISLIATPLTPKEIVRAKMFGAFWATRWVGLVWLLLLLTGLSLGAVHPFGFAAEVLLNAGYLAFACALGTVFSLRSRSSARSLTATVATLIVCNGVYLFLLVPFRMESSLRLLGVTPFFNAMALLSYPDVRSILYGSPGLYIGFGEMDFMFTSLVSLIAYALSAVALTFYLVLNFDDVIDRPRTVGGRLPRQVGNETQIEKGEALVEE